MSNNTKPRLLVVDDDLGVIAAYRHVLVGSEPTRASSVDELEDELFGTPSARQVSKLDWRIHFVDQGEDAVAAVHEAVANCDPFAVVFLDVRMPPGIDGHETARQIRQIDSNVHIVYVSGYSDYDEEELSEAAGTTHRTSFMPKPVWPEQLKATALGHCREAQLLELLNKTRRELEGKLAP